jgi:hypothetical protein
MRAYRARHANRADWVRHRVVRDAAKRYRAEHPEEYAALVAQYEEEEKARQYPRSRRRAEVCQIPGCRRAPVAKDLCMRHYQQARRKAAADG